MEWSKDRTLKLIELLQLMPNLWNPSLCDTRRDKQKRKEELRSISEALNISLADTTKKIQHLRTQYNRESAKEARASVEEPHEKYISNWYAYEYLHFLKDTNKAFRVLQSDEQEKDCNKPTASADTSSVCKLSNLSPPNKLPRTSSATDIHQNKSETISNSNGGSRDEFSVFGEYVANELRSLKGEKNLLVAKKKIQDAIFDVKMGLMVEPRNDITGNVYTHVQNANPSALHGAKIFTSAGLSTAHIEALPSHTPPTSMSEIIINGACHYSNFKVDTQ